VPSRSDAFDGFADRVNSIEGLTRDITTLVMRADLGPNHALADAYARGARTASLQSTPMGQPLYTSLGFHTRRSLRGVDPSAIRRSGSTTGAYAWIMMVRPGSWVWVALTAVCVACTSSHDTLPGTSTTRPTTAQPTSGTPSGPKGALDIVTQLGDQCPQVPKTPDPRCDPKPRPGTSFEVRTADGAVAVTGRSAADGHAMVVLAPGAYVVRGEPVTGYQFTPERRIELTADATVRVPLTYTNGIQ
jgi:hypothetical protein